MNKPAPTPTPLDDDDLFQKLDEYTSALQAGRNVDCRELLRRYPQLCEYVDALDILEHFGGAATYDDETIVSQSETDEPVGTAEGGSSLHGMLGPGDEFGKFRIHAEIGRGGMGVVFRATQTDLKRDVAIKVIRSHQLAGPEELRRFRVEARAAARLHHPHIVAIHEIGEIEGLSYFAMDYVEGETLAERLSRGVLKPEDAAQLLAEIADAVHYLHSQHVLHRDLKPSNILLDGEGKPFVTDFGLARIFGDESQQTRSGAIIGTPSYMSPEQASGRNKLISPATDVYSLGVLLYEMLTGRPPFREENPLDTLVQVIEGEPLLPRQIRKEIPRALERICLKCLEKEPEKRYPTAAALADDLRNFLTGEVVSASSPQWRSRLRRWTRRYPATACRLGGILAVLAILEFRHVLNLVVDVHYHIEVMSIFIIWAAVIGVFQFLSRNPRIAPYLEYGWCATDAIFMTVLLFRTQQTTGGLGPLVIGYPMIVAASGMFFNVGVVIACTLFSCLGYVAIWRWYPGEPGEPLYGTVFLTVLCILGAVTAYQVHRVRVLSRFYDKR